MIASLFRRKPETVTPEFGKGNDYDFSVRVSTANRKLATSAKRKLETWSAKVARENPSPYFRAALCDSAPASVLAKLFKSGASPEHFVDPADIPIPASLRARRVKDMLNQYNRESA